MILKVAVYSATFFIYLHLFRINRNNYNEERFIYTSAYNVGGSM